MKLLTEAADVNSAASVGPLLGKWRPEVEDAAGQLHL